MATDESGFKREVRLSIREIFGDQVAAWTNNDMFASGLPDDSFHFEGCFFPVETKFVKKLPKRGTSKILTHEVSDRQIKFIEAIRKSGGKGMGGILIGFKDVAVIMKELKNNYTVDEVMNVADRFVKVGGVWQLQDFFKIMRGFYEYR